jgi:hypothetical protein
MKISPVSHVLRVCLPVTLVLAQFDLTGCGKEPLAPRPAAMHSAKPGGATQLGELPPDDGPQSAAGPNFAPPNWHGGPRSLPTGPDITPQELKAHVDSMPCVQKAKDSFAARGYVRRPDLDSLAIMGRASTVLLGYQKPGLEISQAEAYIFIATRRVDQYVTAEIGSANDPGSFYEGIVPVTMWQTQVGGGLIVHTIQDSIVFVDTPEDPALMVTTLTGSNASTPVLDGTSIALSGLPAVLGDGQWITAYDLYQLHNPDSLLYYMAVEDSLRTAAYDRMVAEQDRRACMYAGIFLVGFVQALASTYIVAAMQPFGQPILRVAIMLGLLNGAANCDSYWIGTQNP